MPNFEASLLAGGSGLKKLEAALAAAFFDLDYGAKRKTTGNPATYSQDS